MKFYSGFSIQDESFFFQKFSNKSEYCISGFSYGAILAFQDVFYKVQNGIRVDRLQLFSPAFFQTKSKKFKKIQIFTFSKNKQKYLDFFLKGCFFPYKVQAIQLKEDGLKELETLLYYEWNINDLMFLVSKGVKIEVYLGMEDQIIDAKEVKDFFMDVATVTSIKNANHFLMTKNDLEDLHH